MRTVLFIILPFPSHCNACFSLAQEFRNHRFRIIFTGEPYLKEHIEKQGYVFCSMKYTSEYNVQTIGGFVAFFLRSLLDKRDVKERYRVWYESVFEIRKICKQYLPEHIFIDAHLGHYYLYLLKYKQSITILSTELSTKKSFGLPPLNSFYIPKSTALSKAYCEILWTKYIIATELRRLKNKMAFLGRDELSFQDRLCQKHKVQWNSIFERWNTFFIGLKEAPTIILGSKMLEFPTKELFPNEEYLQLPIWRNEDDWFTPRYEKTRKRIRNLRNSIGCAVIYCAFGTLSYNNIQIVSSFITRLITAVANRKDLVLVISTGGAKLSLKAYSDNVFLLERVPQLDILSYSTMMITHGGHNSIKECLQAKVPMLVYPLNTKIDQPGNAVRVYINGYGLFGKINKDTSKEILRKIDQVLLTRNNIKYLREAKSFDPYIIPHAK